MVVYLLLIGLFFAAIAGVGLGLILDNFNRDRPRKITGWFLFGAGLPTGIVLTYLGLYT